MEGNPICDTKYYTKVCSHFLTATTIFTRSFCSTLVKNFKLIDSYHLQALTFDGIQVEDRPIVKEIKTYVREHHPVEKEFVVETRPTGQRSVSN